MSALWTRDDAVAATLGAASHAFEATAIQCRALAVFGGDRVAHEEGCEIIQKCRNRL